MNNKLDIIEVCASEIRGKSLFISDTIIFRCIEGEATIEINENNHNFCEGTNFIIIDSAHLAVLTCSEDFRYTQIKFGAKSFNRIYTHVDTAIINSLKWSMPDICLKEGYRQSELTLQKIIMLNDSDVEHKHLLMRNLIFCYIYESYEISRNRVERQINDSSTFASSLVSRFLVLCRDNHTQHRDISFYSNQLSISNRYLHTVVKNKLQVSPKEIIDGYVISSAKRMLINTTKTSVQIAEELNFPDQSTFGQYFKRIIGISPINFQKNSKLK